MIKNPCSVSVTTENEDFETVADDKLRHASGGYGNWPGYASDGWYGYGNGGGYRPQPQYYTVQRGDNLTQIARGAGDSLNYLLAHNPQYQANPNLIHPGERVFTGWSYPPYYA